MSTLTPYFLPHHRHWLPTLLGVLVLAGLYAISQHNFLVFHALAEAFAIVIAIAVFVIFWNTRELLPTGFFLVVGLGCLFAGLFDLIYIFAYPGMLMFPHAGDGNLALQAKTVAQWYVSLSCVAAFLYLHRKVNQGRVLFVYSAFAALALAMIFYWRVFPDCFVEGVGITPFERFGLVISCTAYLGALILLIRNRREFDTQVHKVLAATLVVFLVQDAVSAVAVRMDGLARIVAHLCQVVAIYFVYKAFVEVGLRKPYDLLFRNLQRSAEDIRQINRRLEERAAQLRALASELTLTEQRERRRLAQVLHDHLQQILVAAKMQLGRVGHKAKDEGIARSLRQVGDLLDQCIAESRALTVELSPPVLFDRGLEGGLEWLVRWFWEKHKLPVVLDLDSGIEPADEGTRVFLFQAARELLFNTVKHARARSAQVRLARLARDRLQLTVTDDGQGFDPANVNPGTSGGFGLFSIRERLELSGGRLEVLSAPGQGSRMTIEVCVGRAAPAAKAALSGSPASGATAQTEIAALRVRTLLADDHAILREGLAGILREHPEVELVGEAKDGQEAVEMALATRPDVILMDITMPHLNGIEATRRVTSELPQVRVIGLSMHEDADMAAAMLRAGAVAYLRKDTASSTLVETILAQGVAVGS